MRWITVLSDLDFAIIEVIVVTEGELVSILLIGVDLVIVFLLWLDSEGNVVEEVISIFFFNFEFGALDGGSRHNIDLATRFWEHATTCLILNEFWNKLDCCFLILLGCHVEEQLHDLWVLESSYGDVRN